MVAWVVIDRRHRRQSGKPSAIRPFPSSFLLHRRLNIWTLRRPDAPFHLPYLLPSSVSRKSFACHSSAPSGAEGRSSLAAILKFFLFTSLRTLLLFFVSSKNSTYLFSNASALFAKKSPGVEDRAVSPLTLIGFPSPHPIKSPHRPHHERKRTRQDEATS